MSKLYLSTNFNNLRLKAAEILLILYVYPINIFEYANLKICICNKEIIGLCLSFNLVLSLVV